MGEIIRGCECRIELAAGDLPVAQSGRDFAQQRGDRFVPERSAQPAEANRLADVAIAEDQAPHFASLPPGSEPASALERAIARDVRQRIAGGQLTGPLQGVTCSAAGTGRTGLDPYSCTVHSAGVAYPFRAVVDERRQRLTWCKIDQPPVANTGPEIQISAN